jgi:uracil-DNA glycosylase family protein
MAETPPSRILSLPTAEGLQSDDWTFKSLDALYAALEKDDHQMPGFGDHAVPGRGPPNATLLLVGEQPGDQEDLARQTFVGPSGKLLEHCLAEASVSPDDVFMTNAVKRFKFEQRGKRRIHQSPNAGDIAHYRWWLGQELRLVDPALVIALGTSALLALLGRQQILKSLRGKVIRWNGRKLLATIHPGYLLRMRASDDFEREEHAFIRDLKTASLAARNEAV